MTEDVTRLALECLKIDLERLRLKEESNKLMMEAFKGLSPMISQFIVALVDSEGEFSPEKLKDLTKLMPGFLSKLSVSDFIEFARKISDDALESLIADLQLMLDDRGKVNDV
ncbi:unnamed protein product [marine sediment metagenome]|uniref:Uncharacterized protein n=1 Tax=marine sediment metagenome TaxID=412755 RepID=X0YIM3_9ZZZZ